MVVNGWVALVGRYIPIGPYRRAAPPSKGQRWLYGAVAVGLAAIAASLLRLHLA